MTNPQSAAPVVGDRPVPSETSRRPAPGKPGTRARCAVHWKALATSSRASAQRSQGDVAMESSIPARSPKAPRSAPATVQAAIRAPCQATEAANRSLPGMARRVAAQARGPHMPAQCRLPTRPASAEASADVKREDPMGAATKQEVCRGIRHALPPAADGATVRRAKEP